MSTTTEPQVGEWWWCQILATGYSANTEAMKHENPVQGSIGELCQWHSRIGWLPDRLVRPIARIPDPPAPEPTEREKVNAMLEAVLARLFPYASQEHCREAGAEIRKSIENTGYVLVPTEGPGFEAMVDFLATWQGDLMGSDLKRALRAAIAAAKGDAR